MKKNKKTIAKPDIAKNIYIINENRVCHFCTLNSTYLIIKDNSATYSCENCISLAKRKLLNQYN